MDEGAAYGWRHHMAVVTVSTGWRGRLRDELER
jgi:hypothetical protein